MRQPSPGRSSHWKYILVGVLIVLVVFVSRTYSSHSAKKDLILGGGRAMATAQELKTGEVIPDVVDNAGDVPLKVSYPSGLVKDGMVLTPTKVHKPPTVEWPAADGYYLLCMTDPDAPSRANPKFREWHHWLVGNIPGNDLAKGETLSAYAGSGPPKGTGLHRYVFLLYKQPGKLHFTEPKRGRTGEGRGLFKIREVAKKYGLGDPIGAVYFQAEWDPYSEKIFDD